MTSNSSLVCFEALSGYGGIYIIPGTTNVISCACYPFRLQNLRRMVNCAVVCWSWIFCTRVFWKQRCIKQLPIITLLEYFSVNQLRKLHWFSDSYFFGGFIRKFYPDPHLKAYAFHFGDLTLSRLSLINNVKKLTESSIRQKTEK